MLKTDLIAPALPRARRDALFPDLRSRLEKILNVAQRLRRQFSLGAAFLGKRRVSARLGGYVEWMTVLSNR